MGCALRSRCLHVIRSEVPAVWSRGDPVTAQCWCCLKTFAEDALDFVLEDANEYETIFGWQCPAGHSHNTVTGRLA